MHSITLPMVGFLQGTLSSEIGFSNDIIQMVVNAGALVKFVLFILCLFSVISWTIIFMKWRQFRKAKLENAYFLELFWEDTDLNKLYQECQDLFFSPVAQLFKSGYSELIRIRKIQAPQSGEWNSGTHPILENVERSLKKTFIHQNGRLEKAVSFLATTGNTAPFIGLFGTVWGIMESFRGIGLKGTASLAVVAPGISEALIATAAGLAAAIPAVIAFNHFNNQVAFLRSEMDGFSSDFLGLIGRQLFKKRPVQREE